jgi:hypothetical protein
MQTHRRRLPNPVQWATPFLLEEVGFDALDLHPRVPAEGATLVTLEKKGQGPGGCPPGTLQWRGPLPTASSPADSPRASVSFHRSLSPTQRELLREPPWLHHPVEIGYCYTLDLSPPSLATSEN